MFQCTDYWALSESFSNVNLSYCTSSNIFIWVLVLDGIYLVYPWIYRVYLSNISMVYPWISMYGYPWNIIWCIHMVYTRYIQGYSWTFLAFCNQISRLAHAAGLIQCAHWQHMCATVWVIKSVYSKRHHGNCARGEGCPQKAFVTGGGGNGCGSSGVAGVFLVS